jgi:predicted phosphodiesterase
MTSFKPFLFLFFWLSGAQIVSGQSISEKFLVKPYLQFGSQPGMFVLWETKVAATTLVEFGEARFLVKKALLDQQVTVNGLRQMHEVELTNLKPETNYFWQIKSITEKGDTIQSEIYSFKTNVQDKSAYMFGLVGDTQLNSRTPWAWGKIAEKLWGDRPNFVVHAGDVVEKGRRKSDWLQDFFPNGHILMSRVPVYTVLGNHEEDSPLYYQYMVAPPPEYYYTFKYGNTQFFMIDSNRDLKEGSEQYNWLEWELAKSTATWKIAIHHHPPYSSDSDDHGNTAFSLSTLGVANVRNLVPLYERFKLDFCLFGHTHLYERSWPILEDRINVKNGVTYINSGGAGGGLEAFAPTRSWFTSELENTHHYCTFSIFENQLIFKAIDHEGRLFDTFQMQKDTSTDAQASIIQPPAVKILADATLFQDKTMVQMQPAFDGLEIRFTTDGSQPNKSSLLYTGPFSMNQSAKITAKAYTKEGYSSRNSTLSLEKSVPQPAVRLKDDIKGIAFNYFEGEWEKLPDFSTLQPNKKGISQQVNLTEIGHREDHFSVVLEGFVDIPKTGLYTFYLQSDDGSKLYLNGKLLIDHDGDHSSIDKTGQAILQDGKHSLRIEYFEKSGSQELQAGIIDPILGSKPFSPFQLSHLK